MNSSIQQTKDSAFKANGRFGRLSFAAWNLLLAIFILALFILASIFFQSSEQSDSIYSGIFFFSVVIYALGIYFSFVFIIRRLHDKNQSGWLSLLVLLPIANLILIIYLLCAKGDPSLNRYGNPRLTVGWEKVLGWIYIICIPVTFVLGILAAISIPAYQDYVERSKQIQIEQNHQQ